MRAAFWVLSWILLSGGFMSLCICIFRRRESRLLDSLQQMLDLAVSGKFRPEVIDESKLSLLENTLKRYIEGSELSVENQALQKQKIQTLISDISHQTVTPIANIKLYAELLEERMKEPAGEMEAIREQIEKLDFLIQSLVKLSRMETGIIAVSARRNRIKDVLEAVESQYLQKAQQKGIRLSIEDTAIQAKFDLKWTIEAVANLVDNAVKYTPGGGCVRIYAKEYELFAKISIEDTGIGIGEEELGQVFSRFYRSLEVSDEPGVGIGLYLSREMIRLQRGYLKADSQKGRGSTFSVFLPL